MRILTKKDLSNVYYTWPNLTSLNYYQTTHAVHPMIEIDREIHYKNLRHTVFSWTSLSELHSTREAPAIKQKEISVHPAESSVVQSNWEALPCLKSFKNYRATRKKLQHNQAFLNIVIQQIKWKPFRNSNLNSCGIW